MLTLFFEKLQINKESVEKLQYLEFELSDKDSEEDFKHRINDSLYHLEVDGDWDWSEESIRLKLKSDNKEEELFSLSLSSYNLKNLVSFINNHLEYMKENKTK